MLPQQFMPQALFEGLPRHPKWHCWFRTFLRAMSPSPLRRDRLRTYSGYLYRLLDRLGCEDVDDLRRLTADAVSQGIRTQHSGSPHTRRLCRIAWNHFAAVMGLSPDLQLSQGMLERRGTASPPIFRTPPPRDHFSENEAQAFLSLQRLPL